MSHVKRKPPRHPGRMVNQKSYRKKLSKTARNVLLFVFITIIFVLSGAITALLIIFS